VRRALLDAAARRRRAAELRLLGIQREEGHTPAASSATYPYKFAMGCMPNPIGAETTPFPDDEQLRSQFASPADAPTRIEAAQQDEREEKGKKEKKTGS
jgi:hypothetical protein